MEQEGSLEHVTLIATGYVQGLGLTSGTLHIKAHAVAAHGCFGISPAPPECLQNFTMSPYWLTRTFFCWEGTAHPYFSHSKETELF